MSDAVAPRITVILAREAPVGVVLRRGPSKWCQLSKWNTQTDKIERGQWLHSRVYEQRSDVSPDGALWIYFAYDGKMSSETKGSYTAVSKPPFYLPLIKWPNGQTTGGGGLFVDRRAVYLAQQVAPLPGREPPRIETRRQHEFGQPTDNASIALYYARLRRDGWSLAHLGEPAFSEGADSWLRGHASAPFKIVQKLPHGTEGSPTTATASYAIEASGQIIPMPDIEWMDFDQAGRLVFTRGGGLWKAKLSPSGVDAEKIADFAADKPAPVNVPPAASRW